MPWQAQDFLEEDREWRASDFEEPEDPRVVKREKLKAEMVEARKVPLNQRLLSAAGAVGDYVVDPISKMNPLTVIPRAAYGAGQVAGVIPTDRPFPLDEDTPLVDLQQALVNPVVEAGSLVDELRYGGQQAAADVGQFFVTPRGISALAASGAPKAAQAALAAGFAGSMAAAVPEAYEATKQAFEGDSTSDKARAALNLAATVAAPVAIGAAALRQGLRPAQSLVAEPAASPIREAERVPVREVPAEVPQDAPVETKPLAPTVEQLAKVQELAVLPEARTIGTEYANKISDLKALQAEAKAKVDTAKADLDATTDKMAKLDKRDAVIALGVKKQLYDEALQVADILNPSEAKAPVPAATGTGAEVIPAAESVAPKTAVFNGIQMAGPSFKYFNEKTGRWNDVSAETAKQRGIEIPAEELAKAEAAQKGTSETKTEGAVEAQPGVGEAPERLQQGGGAIPGEGAVEAGSHPLAPAQTREQFDKQYAGVPALMRERLWIKQAAKPPPMPTPSAQALGIVPPGTGKLMEIIDQAIGKPKEAAPPIKTDTKTPLPDFQDHPASKKIFSQPFGFENLPVIGALFGGTRRLKGHVNESLTTYWAERQIGRSVASAFGSEHSWLDKPFEIKDGQITNITPAKEGASRYISDVFEVLQKDPNAYKLSAEQQKAFDAVQNLEKDFSRLEDRYKVGKGADNEVADTSELLIDADLVSSKGPYFPRIVTERPGNATSGLTRGSSVGSKAFFEKPRMFETEAEGWARGYKYEPSIVNRLATRTERLYKRIADKRLASDPSLEGVGRKEVEAQLKASFAEEMATGEMTEKKIAQMADSIETRGRVYAPAFFNKIFPEETANLLNKAFPKSQSTVRQFAASLNNASKGLQLGLDLGVGFIQGQGLLARHPTIWAKAQFNSVAAMFHVEHFPSYVRNNLEPVRELAQLGSGVGRLEEYMAGLGEKELLSRIPGVKAVTAPFARQFQTFLDVAKVEMWKAFRETTPKEKWSDVAQSIESVLSSGRMEGAGVSSARALVERVLLLAPAYYRGGLNNIANIAERGASGQIVRRAMTAYATAGAVAFYGIAKGLGMSDEDILQRMNPARSDFMLWRIKTKGRISNVGFGGFYRSLLRLMGNTAKTSMDNPENWASLSPDKNPITKWYRGHAGPVVTAAWDGFSGKDYMGEDTDIASIARRAVTPITVQSARGKPGQPTPSVAESAGSFVGLQSYPSTSKTDLNKLHSKWLADNKDPKVKADYERNKDRPREQSKYAVLNTALIDKDQKAAAQAIKDLQTEGVKRTDIFKRMNPYTADGSAQKPLFHESAELERKFKKSLTPEQVKLYEQARQDRKEQWKLFLKAYRGEK